MGIIKALLAEVFLAKAMPNEFLIKHISSLFFLSNKLMIFI